MNQNLRYSIFWSLEFVIMLILAISAGRYVSYIHQQDAQNIAHTNEVIDQIDKTFIIVLRAESAVKSYVALKNPEYLSYYNRLKAEYPFAYADLRYLVQDNVEQRNNVSEFAKVVRDKHDFLQTILRLDQENKLKNTGLEGKSLMDKINLVYNRMKITEYKMLNERTKKSDNNTYYLNFIIPGLVVLSFVLIISSYFLTKNEYA